MFETQQRIGRNLAALRKNVHLSQQEVASRIMISRSCYSDFEQGTRLPDTQHLMALSNFFHIHLNTLVYSDAEAALKEYFLFQDKSNREIALLEIFATLSDQSKGKLMAVAEELAEADALLRKEMLCGAY